MSKNDRNKKQMTTRPKNIKTKKYRNAKSAEENPKKKNKKKSKKIGWKIFRVFLFTFIAVGIIAAGLVLGVVSGIIDDTDSVDLEELELLKLTTFLYDKDGNEMGSLYDSENRISVEYKDLPTHVVDAVVAIEDERFFTHHGVDVKRTAGAIVTYVLNGGNSSFGGSTITQQLVKNIMKDDDVTWQRKIREWYRAYTLEKKLSKEEILEAYLNTIYFGNSAYGIEIASERYFGKSVKDIDLAEAACLAAAIQSPEATNPFRSEEAKQKLLDRQKTVLNKMLELGKITQTEYDEALAKEVVFTTKDVNVGGVQSYFVDAVVEALISDIMEQKDVNRGVAIKMIYTNGYKIYTTFDPSIQEKVDAAYDNPNIFYTDWQGDFMQSAMVVMDHSNGNVLAISGGADEKTGALTFNRATQLRRQPGSCMKPIGAYGPAFELGVLSPGSGLDDSPLPYGSYNPGNYYGYFKGYVTAREALAYSMNLPALRANMKVDTEYAFNFAENCGLTLVSSEENSNANDENPASLALGGLTKGVTVLEMATAYSTIANGGLYIEPRFYTKVLDRHGEEVIVKNSEPKRVMKATTAYMLTSCLQSVFEPGGTAWEGNISVNNMSVAGKTGNTNGNIDRWFCGYSPYYTIACWNGYDMVGGEPGTKDIGRGYPYTSMTLFQQVMTGISEGQEWKNFEKPSGIVEGAVCKDSGLVATDACRADQRGDRTRTDIFASGTVPTKTCTVHKMVKVCSQTGKIATEYCPSTAEKSFITRDSIPYILPNDWGYMAPTETCDVHTTKVVDPDDEVQIYTEGLNNKNNKNNKK